MPILFKVFSPLIFIYKLFCFLVILGSLVIYSFLGRGFYTSRKARRRFHSVTVSFFCRLFFRVCFMRHKVNHAPTGDQHYLVISNHLGLIDILVHAAVRPSLFITSVDMHETPVLGFLTELGACLYVERRNRNNIQNEMQDIKEALEEGFQVILFPEATSNNGEKVYPFKKTLMTSAAGTGIPLLPAVINYLRVNGEAMSHKWRDHVCWYGDSTFVTALIKILSLGTLDVSLDYFDPIMIHTEEERKEVAARIQTLVESKYIPITYPGLENAH